MVTATGTNYGNAQYPYGAYPQGPPQQSSQQGLPIIPQPGQQQYSANYGPPQQPQPPYFNRQPSSSVQGNNPLLPIAVNNQATNLAQPSNGNPVAPQLASNPVAIPSNPVAPPQTSTAKPSVGSPGPPQSNNEKQKLSKKDSDLLKSLQVQAGGTAELQSGTLCNMHYICKCISLI